ncbi:MAG: glycosyltransferase [Proteobacteria bacterium]|nr:glycosyltransferase [Pseudomonadota bacterium]
MHSHEQPGFDWLLTDRRTAMRPEALDLALDAWKRGHDALAAGDVANARYWAERAARLGPDDTQVRFLLGIVLLRERDPEALGVFRRLAAISDTAPAHRGVATAASLVADPALRRDATAALLSRFAPPSDPDFRQFASRIADAASLPGWCGADACGRVTVMASGTVTLALDGVAVTARRQPDGSLVLPRAWMAAAALSVMAGGRHLLGSPIDLERRRLVEGFVESPPGAEGGGLSGWAWNPADADAPIRLRLTTESGRPAALVIAPDGPARFPNMDGLTAPRAFQVPPKVLQRRRGLLHVTDTWGHDLTGSPLDPHQWEDAATAAARMMGPSGRKGRSRAEGPALVAIWADTRRPMRDAGKKAALRGSLAPAVVVPVFRGLETTRLCLARVLATVPAGTPVIVVEDASPEPALVAALTTLARDRRITLIRNPRNLGFPGSANAGIAAAGSRDVVLLNSDAMVPAGWLERLRDAAWSARDIGTVAPLSNDATILSYPHVNRAEPPPEPPMLGRIDRMAARVNAGLLVEIPTSVGFCMYIRRDCLAETGPLREDVFAQGYGEENDFCLRSRHLGWRHMAAAGVFVSHVGGQSFRAAREHLLRRNLTLLERLHPGYHDLIAAHVAADPLAEARRRLDLARWRGMGRSSKPSVILITHDEGGGVERQIGARSRSLAAAGFRPILLRPGGEGICRVAMGVSGPDAWRSEFPNLRYRVPDELAALATLLRRERPDHVELHHRLGHSQALLTLPERLDVPLDIVVHDYAAICPRMTLVTTTNRYCGEPEAAQCETCIADLGSRLREDIPVAHLRRWTASEFAAARRVVFPSGDAEKRLRRYVPRLRGEIRPWEDDAAPMGRTQHRHAPLAGRRSRIAIIGAIGTEKGYDVVLACARDAAQRNLPMDFVIIGYTHDDMRLIDTGRVQITYRFAPETAVAEITAQAADIAFIPSIWPETWCFALSDAWAAGLRAAVFDIGTQAERMRAAERGWVLPLALPVSGINNSLIAFAEAYH